MPSVDQRDREIVEVFRRRYMEARQAGLEHVEAETFASSDVDIGELRRLVRGAATPTQIARLLLP